MAKTTIEVTEAIRDELQDERLDRESNYSQTIERLLDMEESPYVTEAEAREIARETFEELAREMQR